jgi:hypothetical protein
MSIVVARDFSETPGPRSREEGDFSGEQFLEEILLPFFRTALTENKEFIVDLDGTEGYATSFLEAAFGGLARLFEARDIVRLVRFKSDDEPYLIEEIKKYVAEARKQ